jgi:hypothetical protein
MTQIDELVKQLREFDYREDVDALMMTRADVLESQSAELDIDKHRYF